MSFFVGYKKKAMCESLSTGDLVLVSEYPEVPQHWLLALFNDMIRWVTRSPYTHVGMILRDPPFMDEGGVYVWESGWEGTPDPQDGRVKLGVQLTPWSTFVENTRGALFVRKREKGSRPLSRQMLSTIHAQVYGKPYDVHVSDWLAAAVRYDPQPQKTDRFWCSALVAYILVQCGTLDPGVDWSMVRPGDLSSDSRVLHWNHGYGPDTPVAPRGASGQQ